MKKFYFLLSLFLLVFLEVFSQKEVIVTSNSRSTGVNLLTGKSVMAGEYKFPKRIHQFHADTEGKFTVELRDLSRNGNRLKNKGYLVRYDAECDRVLWFKKLNYQYDKVDLNGGFILYSHRGVSYCLDKETGDKMWELKNSLVYIDPVKNIGLGYKNLAPEGFENMLQGIDLITGRLLWQRIISKENGWNNVFYLNDSTLMIAASGLHAVNIFNGKGWDYNTVTGKKDYTASAIGTGLGIAAGLLTGMYTVVAGYSLIHELVSNVMVDSSYIYFASREQIVKLNKNGETIWLQNLPKDLTSTSRIIKSNNLMVMVNYGYAWRGHNQFNFGTPFIAAFNLETGEQKYLIELTDNRQEFVRSIDEKEKEIAFLFQDRILKYRIIDGQMINMKSFDPEKFGKLDYFAGELAYVRQDSLFVNLEEIDPRKHHLVINNEKVLVLNSNLEIEGEFKSVDVYAYTLNLNDKKFLVEEDQIFFIVNEKGREIARLSVSGQYVLTGEKLYVAEGNVLLGINLEEIIKDGSVIEL